MVVVAIVPLVEMTRTLVARPAVVLYGDQALLALGARRAARFDQLLGPYSRTGFHHPGPILFYLLAPFTHLPGGAGDGLYVGASALNLAALVATVVLIGRRVSPTAALLAAVALDAYCLCLGVGTLRQPWNPYLVVAPMILLAVLWALSGSVRDGAAVWMLVVGSFEVQTHVSTMAVVAVLAGLLVVRPKRSGAGRPLGRPAGWGTRVGLAALVGAWVAPVVELFADHPDNVQEMWSYVTGVHPHDSAGHSLRVALDSLTILPFGNRDYVPSLHHTLPEFGITLLLSVVASVLAWRLGGGFSRRLVVAGAVVAAVGTASLVGSGGQVMLYFAVWISVAPVLVLLALGAAVAPRWGASGGPAVHLLGAVAVVVCAVVLISDLSLPAVDHTIGSGPWPAANAGSAAGRHHTATDTAVLERAALAAVLPLGRHVVLDISSPEDWPYAAGIVLYLDEHGVDTTVTPGSWQLYFGSPPARAPGAPTARLVIGPTAGTETGEVLADVDGVLLGRSTNP